MSASVKPKGRDPFVGVRIPPHLIGRIDAWAKAHAMNRSEAVRRLVETGLRDGPDGGAPLVAAAMESLLKGLSRR